MVVFPTLMINGTTFPKIYQLLQVYTVPPLREKVPPRANEFTVKIHHFS